MQPSSSTPVRSFAVVRPAGTYAALVGHLKGCEICTDAGGELAAPDELCSAGRRFAVDHIAAEVMARCRLGQRRRNLKRSA